MPNSPFETMKPYLDPKAKEAIESLQAEGIEPDLALTYLELTCSEESLYDMPIYPEELDDETA